MCFNKFHNFSGKILLCLFFLISSLTFAQKTDVIVLLNGDKITGEVKEMLTGLLKLSTNSMSTIYIEWNKISEIRTDKIFEVEITDGRIYYGSFQPSEKKGMIILKGVTLENELFMKYIVRITRIRESFWDILQGYLKLGVSYSKSSKIADLNFGADVIYTTKSQRSELTLNSNFSSSEGNPSSSSNNASYGYNRFLGHKWFYGGLLIAEQNSELGLKLRTTLGGALGNDFIQTNKNFLNAVGGLSVSKEWYDGEAGSQNDLTAYISSKFQYFIYDHPGINLYSFLSIYPYLTNFGRIRINYTLNFDWEIISDFYWNLGFYLEYDNEPQSIDASTIDYNISMGLKYNL
jgi:hypothetical protein